MLSIVEWRRGKVESGSRPGKRAGRGVLVYQVERFSFQDRIPEVDVRWLHSRTILFSAFELYT